MRLKRVRLFGFKTFADRTEVDLEGGVVAVVGPNGCGKSNLVDAILWGLGEGNSRHLRAQSSQDVIFSGSSRRKPVGFAEVSLLFDNEDGLLPIDTPEVSISRKLTRSGDSEYSINRQSCRLRDVYELLADSGLGRAGYAIVGQKEIDAALSASAEDRRGWIDEAAGVQRYRARKTESLRRLAQAVEHLSRVSDILRELESQREPLRDEAEVARRYRNVLESLREVEVGLLVNETAKAVREVDEAEKRIKENLRLSQEEMTRSDKIEAELKRASEEVSAIEQRMETLRSAQHQALTATERADANLRVLQERLQSLDEQERHLSEDAGLVQERIAAADVEAAALGLEAEAEAEALKALQIELAGAGEETKRLSKALAEVEQELTKARQQHQLVLKRQAEAAHRAERAVAAKRELAGIAKSMPDLEAAVGEADLAYQSLAGAATEQQSRLGSIEEQLAALRTEEDREGQESRRALAEKATLDGRIRGIEATIDSHEGLNQGSRAVLEAAERGLLSASYVPVAEAVEVDKELALAIETALGGSANDLIVDEPDDAKAAIDWLKNNRAGRATFQPIPLMRPFEASQDLKRLLNERGVVGRASELVRSSGKYRPVIDSLLGRIVVVETLDDGLRLARTSGWSRMVTLEGEVLHSGGAVTGGQQSRQSYGLVQRKADLAELEGHRAQLEKVLKSAERKVSARASRRAELQAEREALNQKLKQEQRANEEARQYLQTLQGELRTAQKERERLEHELEVLSAAGAEPEALVDTAAIEVRRDEVLKQLATKAADQDQAIARLRDAETRVSQSRARAESARLRLRSAKESEETRQKRLSGLGPERERIRVQVEQGEVARKASHAESTAAETALSAAQAERVALLEASLKLTEEARAIRENLTAISDAAHQAELTRARAESRRANAVERLYQEYGLTEEDALEQEGKHEVPADAVALVPRLRRELKSMGDVNIGAIEAYERLTTRLEELGAQKADIEEGMGQVQSGIRELDKLTRDRFLDTFAAVQEAFSEMFLRLFGGGEGKLSLSDGQNVLETGVELEVTLPGKKRQALALLSGGERSLCASAFLFALLQVKPSPLVVLDEVDAPLDGANVERFADTLLSFTKTTQFIVITHNPSTIERAPVWLGVTMQEPGISTLVPMRMPSKVPVLEGI